MVAPLHGDVDIQKVLICEKNVLFRFSLWFQLVEAALVVCAAHADLFSSAQLNRVEASLQFPFNV